ncbi:acyltransferase family protein [Enterococcus faecium]|uniref:acyltransferase family protein n=1 Tax=Enterococcus faecium TaxID=1352 RepID=UPI003627490E
MELNWLRGFAALIVMLFHYTQRYTELFTSNIDFFVRITWGAAAVNVFFILSGFLGIYSLNTKDSVLKYLKKKIHRLYPVYWMCLLISVLFQFFFMDNRFVGWKVLLINFTMFQDFIGVPSVDGAYWTLAYELRFYIFIGVVLFMKKTNKIKLLTIMWVIFSAIISILEYDTNIFRIIDKLFNYVLMPNFCSSFSSGIFLYYILCNKRDFISKGGLIMSLILSYFTQSFQNFICLVVVVIIMFVIINIRNNSSNKYLRVINTLDKGPLRWLSFISIISFPLYLIHQYVGYCILILLENIGFRSEWILLVPIVVSITIAYFVHNFVEIKRRGNI